MSETRLGRFGHHPDPAIDFCHEVECCENDAFDLRIGIGSRKEVYARVDRAMSFRVGGDIGCIHAKRGLRQLEDALKAGKEREFLDHLFSERAQPERQPAKEAERPDRGWSSVEVGWK